MANNYCSTNTGSDSWDYQLRTPPRPRQDLLNRRMELDELENTQKLLREIEIDRKTCTGPTTYAGYTPKRLIARKRSDAEKKRLLLANRDNDAEKPPLKRQKKIRFSSKCKNGGMICNDFFCVTLSMCNRNVTQTLKMQMPLQMTGILEYIGWRMCSGTSGFASMGRKCWDS